MDQGLQSQALQSSRSIISYFFVV